jgi:hypothetical protein
MAVPAVPVKRIAIDARKIDVRKGFLVLVRLVGTLFLAIPYGLAWGLRVVWLGLTMLWVAAATGWRDAGRPERSEDGTRT